MAKKTWYRRRARRADKTTFNYIAKNYLKYKVKSAFMVNIAQSGMTGDHSLTFENILNAANDFAALGSHFLQYKITGVSLNVAPTFNDEDDGQFNFQSCAVAMSIMNVSDNGTWDGVSKSPNALLIGDQKVFKYYKLNTGWFAVNNQAAPSLKIVTQTRGVPLAGQITVNFIVTFYVTFKDAA